MGCFSGPKVESSQLVAAFDAANSKGFDSKENLVTATATDFNYPFNNQIISTANDVAPDGTTVLCKHDLAGATSPFLNCRADITLSSGNTYTMSMYLKGTTSFSASFAFVGETTNEIYANTANITTAWQRFTLTFTLIATQTSSRLQLFFATQGEGKIVSVWGAQLERGSVATNYTSRTTGTAKTRGTTLTDLSGRSNTGALTNGPTYSSVNGGSIVFDGTNDYVTLPTNLLIHETGNPFTFSIWFKTSSTGIILGQQNNPTPNAASGYVPAIYVGTDGLLYTSCFWGGSTGNQSVSSSSVNNSSWNNITVTFAANSQISYLNGVSYATLSKTQTNYSSTYYYFLGSGQGAGWTNFPASPYLNGSISNFSYYNRSLSAVEVSQNFNALRGRFGI
jgi:hypothetical protein